MSAAAAVVTASLVGAVRNEQTTAGQQEQADVVRIIAEHGYTIATTGTAALQTISMIQLWLSIHK